MSIRPRMEQLLAVLAIILTPAGAQESQLIGPENTLSIVGSNAVLKCLYPSKNCRGLVWLKNLPDTKPTTVFIETVGIYEAFLGRYSVDNSTGCDLVIKRVELKDAGRFICTTSISSNVVEKAASLIVLSTQPKCAISASAEKSVDGDVVHLTCELTYNGTSNASMVWKGVKDAPAAVESRKTVTQSYVFTASAPEIPSFTCATEFTADKRVAGLATNIPIATSATPAIKVFYSVRNMTLSPSLSVYLPGTRVTCTVKGHPTPNVRWQEYVEKNYTWSDVRNQTNVLSVSSVVTSRRFRCVAVNVVRNQNYTATSHLVQFNNIDEFSSTTAVTSLDRLGVGIGIGLVAAIVLACVVLAILTRLGYLEFHSRPANKSFNDSAQRKDQEMLRTSIQKTATKLVGEQESAYASLATDRDANEYESLEKQQKVKPKKKSKP